MQKTRYRNSRRTETPPKKGWRFDKHERRKVAGVAKADGFHSNLQNRKKPQRSDDFQGNPKLMTYLQRKSHYPRIRSYASSGKLWTSKWDHTEFHPKIVSLFNNESIYAEFQFLLTGDLSALKRSDLKWIRKRMSHWNTCFAATGFKIKWEIVWNWNLIQSGHCQPSVL